ncbi:Bug family tripartite tricarboxylate transporter substrate binding protein [Cupriavidus pauculus]|uniref:Tripartite tricarboxylate transporter substrate binding protein n=1 Tax=Cupriavidus pauculus TaxID=82633 RepID=A0A3G8H9I8_9BURK|nr:tripartite tricarboxylate transporter substrate binding protein [Cupriavidus pauculus]AZG17227.1 tripartite tricarboxylate transporter substrate binding protein [Cupriavidus pauculus]
MPTPLRKQVRLAFAVMTSLVLASASISPAQAQTPIRLIVPTQAGSQADAVARAMSQSLSKNLGHSVVVENLPGAGGVPGTQQLVRAPKDGTTLGLISSNHVINPFIYKNMPYDALKDITPITVIGTLPLVLVVNPSVRANNTKELVALLKSKPGEFNYGSSGNGTVLHLAGQLFASEAKVEVSHVPYKGAGNYTTDLVGGQVQLGFLTLQTVLPLVKAGKLKAIAVSTTQRVPGLPDVPTLAESGLPQYNFDAWLAIVGPAGMQAQNVAQLQSKIKATLQDKDVQEQLAQQGVIVSTAAPESAGAFMKTELDKHARIVKQAGATLN